MNRRGLNTSNTAPVARVKLISAHMRFTGRNSKLTMEMLKEIVQHLTDGLPVMHACNIVGITEDTWYRWQKQGELYLQTGAPEEYEVFGIFTEEVKKAISTWQLNLVKRLNGEQYKPTWVRDVTLLERRDRGHWGRSDAARTGGTNVAPDERFL